MSSTHRLLFTTRGAARSSIDALSTPISCCHCHISPYIWRASAGNRWPNTRRASPFLYAFLYARMPAGLPSELTGCSLLAALLAFFSGSCLGHSKSAWQRLPMLARFRRSTQYPVSSKLHTYLPTVYSRNQSSNQNSI